MSKCSLRGTETLGAAFGTVLLSLTWRRCVASEVFKGVSVESVEVKQNLITRGVVRASVVLSPLAHFPDLKSRGKRQRGGASLDSFCVLCERGGSIGLTARVFAGAASPVARVLPTCTLAEVRLLN